MKRTTALAISSLCAVALLAAAASPASAAAPPPGKGLVDFGTFTCEGVGDVTVIGPRGPKAATAFTTTGLKVALFSLDITGTDLDGNPIDFSKTYGKRSALTPITCTQHFEEGQANLDITAVVGLVPPQ
jgi:hypothetical protein